MVRLNLVNYRRKRIKKSARKTKNSRLTQQQEVRDVVDLDGAPDVDEDTNIAEVEEVDAARGKTIRKIGPMDNFTMPLDQDSLSSTRVIWKQLITESIMKERMHSLQRYIARWVYVRGVAFNQINNVEFDQVIEVAGRFGPGGKKPNQHQLREKLLFEEVEETKKMMKAHEEEWAKNGCSIMIDAWTDQIRRSIMNMCMHCTIGSRFLESKETLEESHTGQLIFEYLDGCIERVGAENVVQVVIDNASNNMVAKDLLFMKRPNIFWTSCATHTLNLMLEGIGKMKKFKGYIDQAKSLTIFIYAHHRTLALMRKYTKKRDIVRPGATRFASNFLTLQSLYEKKEQLRAMSQCDEWDKFLGLSHIKKNSKGVLATSTMTIPTFWSGVTLCLRVFEPLIKVLRMVDSDIKPSLSFLYGDIIKAKEEIKTGFRNIEKTRNLNLYNNVIEIIDDKMKDRLDTPLHKVAYLLNPYYSYNDDSIFMNEEIMDGFFTIVETFYHGDYDKQNKVLNEELCKFREKQGHFGKPVAKASCKQYDFNPEFKDDPYIYAFDSLKHIGIIDLLHEHNDFLSYVV
ncbi:uncharacterized protein [Miscanthus floridulus]|uniref:uncharacterized protein n=1 Tax=Miscanthus floridulus TaxID=154761 RepID=UPI00345742D4